LSIRPRGWILRWTDKEIFRTMHVSAFGPHRLDARVRRVRQIWAKFAPGSVDGELCCSHEAAVVRREKGRRRPISAGSAMRWSGVIEGRALCPPRLALPWRVRSPSARETARLPDAGALQVLRQCGEVAHCRLARAVKRTCRGARGAALEPVRMIEPPCPSAAALSGP